MLGYGAGLAIVLSAFNYTGGKLSGYVKDPSVDGVERKEYMRKNRRRPLEETVQELGEGRGKLELYRQVCPEVVLTDPSRYLRSRIRGAQGRKAEGEIRHRCASSSPSFPIDDSHCVYTMFNTTKRYSGPLGSNRNRLLSLTAMSDESSMRSRTLSSSNPDSSCLPIFIYCRWLTKGATSMRCRNEAMAKTSIASDILPEP